MKEKEQAVDYVTFDDENGKQQLIKVDVIQHVFYNEETGKTVIRMTGNMFAFTNSDAVLPHLQNVLFNRTRII